MTWHAELVPVGADKWDIEIFKDGQFFGRPDLGGTFSDEVTARRNAEIQLAYLRTVDRHEARPRVIVTLDEALDYVQGPNRDTA